MKLYNFFFLFIFPSRTWALCGQEIYYGNIIYLEIVLENSTQ